MLDREQILEEIRRCAAANDGKPLGRSAFERETGITSPMIDRYWIRWGDAVAEAGLAPNAFLNAPLPEEQPLEALALLTRELGHYPVKNELVHKRRQSPQFPSHNTFERLGDKDARMRRLAAYCDARPDLADVRDLIGDLPSDRQDAAPPSTKGFVYLARSGKHYKIGQTGDLVRRTNEIRLQLPERVELVHQVATDDPVGIERYWHQRFADRRANGEWFALTHADVSAFKRRKFM